MSKNKKICSYKGCVHDPDQTHFKFPTDPHRFYIWSQCAGLNLKGEIDPNELRFLCEKHFSHQYLSQQSRRKMLVQTAIPEKWRNDLIISDKIPDSGEFTIISKESPKQRKSKYTPRSSTGDKTIEENLSVALHNNPKHKLDTLEDEEIDEEEIQTEELEIYENQIVNAKPDPDPTKKPLLIVVKRQKLNPPKTIMNFTNKPQVTIGEESTFIVTEEGNISATSEKPKKVEQAPKPKLSTQLEGCTEFIFNGEIYVQMPKRVFEAEQERLREDVEKYKETLREMRATINETLNSL